MPLRPPVTTAAYPASACPHCGAEITAQGLVAVCTRCDRNFPIQDRVIDFRQPGNSYYNNPLTPADMLTINGTFLQSPWSETLNQFLQLSGDSELWLDNLLDEGRFACKIFLGIRPDARLLDYGCSLGTSTKNLAPQFSKTYALEQTLENAIFTRKRLDQSNPNDDITIAVSEDGQALPLQSSSIDVVTNIGSQSQKLELLHEFSRVLKRDGQLFIRCDNRLDYKQFTDSSNKTKTIVASIIPRGVAKALGRQRDSELEGSNACTLWRYRKLLKQAGFNKIDFIALFEDDNLSEEMRPGPGKFPLWSPQPCSDWKQRLKQSPLLAQSFGIIASKKTQVPIRLEAEIAEQVSNAQGLKPQHFRTSHYLVSRKGKLICRTFCGEQEIYVRLPLTENAVVSEIHNHSVLEWLGTEKPALSGLFPQPVFKGEIQKQIVLAETAVPGAPLVDLLKRQQDAAPSLRIGLEFLIRLNDGCNEDPVPFTGSTYQRLVLNPLHSMTHLVTPDELTRLEAFFSLRLENKRLPRGLMHGDYGARNILVDGEAVSGLLDWEESDRDGLPALDAICLVFSCYSRLGKNFKGGLSLVEMAKRDGLFKDYLPALDQFYRQTGVDNDYHESLVLLYWVHVIAHRVALGRTVSNSSSELMVRRIVNMVLDTSAA